MSRIRIRWVLTRVALIVSILFVVMLIIKKFGLLDKDNFKVAPTQKPTDAQTQKPTDTQTQKPTDTQTQKPTDTQTQKSTDTQTQKLVEDFKKLAGNLKRLAVELSETRRKLSGFPFHHHRIGQHIDSLNGIIKSLAEETVSQDDNSPGDKPSLESSSSKKEVCPEKYMGKLLDYDWPFFRKGFERVNCSEFVPFNDLVTLLLILPEELSRNEQLQFFQGLEQYHPSVGIVLASKEKFPVETLAKLNLNVTNIVFKDLTHGETWSKLLQEVTTPYVLVAPDVTHFNDDVNLKRLVRVLSENKDAIIAGGSHRNLQGEWDIGCLQVTLKNWTAYFRGGYYQSFRTECIVCDVLSSPFMAKTEGLKEVKIDESLLFGVFQDMFWRLKTEHPEKVVVSCPDVMFYTYSREIPDERYVDLAKKWDLKKWVEPGGRVRWYGCRHGYSHTSAGNCGSFQAGMGVPPCDLENLADTVKFIMKACEDAGVLCELTDGTLTGAVKFNKVLPWERDADITFLSANFTALKKLESKFNAAGYGLSIDDSKLRCCVDGRMTGGYFGVQTTHWRLELWGQYKVESEDLIANGLKPTKVRFAGQWVNVNRNPGLFIRQRYGYDVYQHVEHWTDIGDSTSWQFYRPSTFTKCPRPGHTGCLDQFPTDGNLEFSDYSHI